jgi:hypothetical protein
MKIRFLLLFILPALVACKKEEPKSIIYGYEYFPVQPGNYVIYNVVDIFHDIVLEPAHDTSRYQIKELITDLIIDEEGDTAYKIKRFIRANDTLGWTIKDIWTTKRTKTTAEVVEENQRKIKMVFAIAYNRTWNDNALNAEESNECYYENIYLPFNNGTTTFPKTVTVVCKEFTSFVDHRVQREIYAENIGKVYSVYKDLQIDNFDTTNIQKGPEIYYSAIEFGQE